MIIWSVEGVHEGLCLGVYKQKDQIEDIIAI